MWEMSDQPAYLVLNPVFLHYDKPPIVDNAYVAKGIFHLRSHNVIKDITNIESYTYMKEYIKY